MPIEKLREWFAEHKREFPWREDKTPYAVWISEVMLQQTRADVVVPYFLRWMERFPDLLSLARAEEAEVVKLWEGLGYYARARRLHAAARYVQKLHGGELPSTQEALEKIPGFGPYTVGAVRSFAFLQRAAAVDGNVLRVLARFFALEEDIARSATQAKLRQLAEELLPEKEPWMIAEALIELGALICKPKPKCQECPLQDSCRAWQLGKQEELPLKGKPLETLKLKRRVFVLLCGERILLQQVQKGKVMEGLYEFPYLEIDSKFQSDESVCMQLPLESIVETASLIASFDEVSHTFTRYQAKLFPSLWRLPEEIALAPYTWYTIPSLQELPFSAGHRRIAEMVTEYLGRYG